MIEHLLPELLWVFTISHVATISYNKFRLELFSQNKLLVRRDQPVAERDVHRNWKPALTDYLHI